ncbi:Trigger factor [Porphyridium purpureum]|uniref:peptidylprolyl isomerase n=1 Tax=Porphyridium purpureum TaxID=35688 RepID=A0A5J4YTR8_PORPP|nr:Trigger factor [Porphyridium purpureum]|eukprot:POR9662..scf227_4
MAFVGGSVCVRATPEMARAPRSHSCVPQSKPALASHAARLSPRRCRAVRAGKAVVMAAAASSALAEGVEQLPDSQVGIEVCVSAQETAAAFDKVMREMGGKAQIPGFRKGKVPKQVLLSHFGPKNVYGAACEEVFNTAVGKTLQEKKINYIGQAAIDGDVDAILDTFRPGEAFKFKIKIDVWPTASFSGEYKGMSVEAEEELFDEALVENALVELQKKNALPVIAPEGTKAAMGQVLVATMTGFFRNDDGSQGAELPEIADGKSIEVQMESGVYMPGLVEGIVGASIGETRLVPVDFPDNAPRAELRNIKALFKVDVEAIKNKVVPELDDEFAQQVSEEDTLEALKANIRERLGSEASALTKSNIQRALEDKLREITEVALPVTLVQERTKSKFASMMADWKDQGMPEEQVRALITPENFEKYAKKAGPNVEKQLALSFAFQKIAEIEGLKPSAGEVDDQITIVRGELKGQEVDEELLRENVEAELVREKVLDFLKDSATIKLVPKAKV